MSDAAGDLNVCSVAASDSSWEDVEDKEPVFDARIPCNPDSLLMNSWILEKIFQFLPLNELRKCRLVCTEWNKTALLRSLIGSKFKKQVVFNQGLDKLLKIAQNSLQPFCRQFELECMRLEVDQAFKFVKYFGKKISHLSIRACENSPKESVIEILKCRRLEELLIHGGLPKTKEKDYPKFLFKRLKVLTFSGSYCMDNKKISEDFIAMVLKRSPNLEKIRIISDIELWDKFSQVLAVVDLPKLCKVQLDCVGQLPNDFLKDFFVKKLILREICIDDCRFSKDFLEQLLLQTYETLVVLHISERVKTQILTTAFSSITLPNMKEVSLSIDGIDFSGVNYIVEACPKLKVLKVEGLFQTKFKFQDKNLLSLCVQETTSSAEYNSDTIIRIIRDKQREFLKVIFLMNLLPKKLIINWPDLTGRCLRRIYDRFPNLEFISFEQNSARECIVGLTGIPYRIYQRMAQCKSFSVIPTNKFNLFSSISKLQCLKRLELTLRGDISSTELTLILFAYGISGIRSLQELVVNGLTISDVSLMILSQNLNLSLCKIDGSTVEWDRFQSFYKQHTVRSFLLPPSTQIEPKNDSPAHLVGMNSQFLAKVFNYLGSTDVFEARKVCSYWHTLSSEHLHRNCEGQSLTEAMEKRLTQYVEKQTFPAPHIGYKKYFARNRVENRPIALRLWGSIRRETTMAIVGLRNPTLENFLMNYDQHTVYKPHGTCRQRNILEYWGYPDGTDMLVHHPSVRQEVLTDLDQSSCNFTTLLVIGSWSRNDGRYLEFLNPLWNLSTIHLIGLESSTFDIILPKLTQMTNLESLWIKSIHHDLPYKFELTKTHLQILCNATFKLKSLTMQIYGPPKYIAQFVQSQSFTLETLNLDCSDNISDRLTLFSIPHLRILQLDEPPGHLLWKMLTSHPSLETISFGQTPRMYVGYSSSPKMNLLEPNFQHSATEILCNVNWFLENRQINMGYGRTKGPKFTLQQTSDAALKFLIHFPHLSSLTLRGVHAHYGILRGIFKKFPQLKKLELINATGVTDEILTGISKEVLDEMDVMSPFHVRLDRPNRTQVKIKAKRPVSIRNLKCLTHLALDGQPACTDLSVIFGLLNLSQLQYLSCEDWKISDISIRALADILPSLKEINTTDCPDVSKYALEYFKESRIKRRQGLEQ